MPNLVESCRGPYWCWPGIIENALKSGQWWDQQIQAALDSADPRGWALDLGAHIGWFTTYLAARHPFVVALEAHPVTFALLRKNLTLHRVANVVTLPLAAYSETTMLNLASSEMLGWPVPDPVDLDQGFGAASLAFVPDQVHQAALRVPAVRVDSLIPRTERVSCIKIDVQGCDLRALHGLRQVIARDSPVVVFEYEQGASQWHGDTWDDYVDFFSTLEYDVTRIREDLWDFVARPR